MDFNAVCYAISKVDLRAGKQLRFWAPRTKKLRSTHKSVPRSGQKLTSKAKYQRNLRQKKNFPSKGKATTNTYITKTYSLFTFEAVHAVDHRLACL